MESLFFNTPTQRYQIRELFQRESEYLRKIDISNGIFFYDIALRQRRRTIELNNMDRMVMIVMVKQGEIILKDAIANKRIHLKSTTIGIYCSSKQRITLEIVRSKKSEMLILFVADFFLKRYLNGQNSEPIDFLYNTIQQEISLEEIDQQPIDALTLYSVEKLLNIKAKDSMKSIRAEHRVMELMIHCFSLIDIVDEQILEEERLLAHRAKEILLEDFVSPPTIKELAHLCATNESKLKKVFKKVYKSTLHAYVQKLRLEQASLLLKEESLTIGEIAKRVGYRHQGYFSKLFFRVYGVYPVALQ